MFSIKSRKMLFVNQLMILLASCVHSRDIFVTNGSDELTPKQIWSSIMLLDNTSRCVENSMILLRTNHSQLQMAICSLFRMVNIHDSNQVKWTVLWFQRASSECFRFEYLSFVCSNGYIPRNINGKQHTELFYFNL